MAAHVESIVVRSGVNRVLTVNEDPTEGAEFDTATENMRTGCPVTVIVSQTVEGDGTDPFGSVYETEKLYCPTSKSVRGLKVQPMLWIVEGFAEFGARVARSQVPLAG